jgi:hypothetical protein
MSTTPRHPSALPAATPAGLTDPTTRPITDQITDPRGAAGDVGAGDVGAGDVPVPLARLAGALLAGLAAGLLICAALVMTLGHPHHHRGGADNTHAALTLAAFTTHTGAPAPVTVRELNPAAPTHRPALPASLSHESGDCSDWQRLTPAVGPDNSEGSDGSGDGPGRRPGLLVHAPGVDVSVGVDVSARHCDHSRDDSRGDSRGDSWDGSWADPSADHHNGRDGSGRDDGRDDDRHGCGCGDRQSRPWNGHGPADRSSWTPYGYTNPNPNGPGYPAGYGPAYAGPGYPAGTGYGSGTGNGSGTGYGTGYGAQVGYPSGGGYSNGYPAAIPAGCRVIADANDPRGLIVCPSAPGW